MNLLSSETMRHLQQFYIDGEWVESEQRTYDPKAIYGGSQ